MLPVSCGSLHPSVFLCSFQHNRLLMSLVGVVFCSSFASLEKSAWLYSFLQVDMRRDLNSSSAKGQALEWQNLIPGELTSGQLSMVSLDRVTGFYFLCFLFLFLVLGSIWNLCSQSEATVLLTGCSHAVCILEQVGADACILTVVERNHAKMLSVIFAFSIWTHFDQWDHSDINCSTFKNCLRLKA